MGSITNMKLTRLQLMKLTRLAEKAATQAGSMIESIIENDPRLKQVSIKQKQSGSSPASQVVTEVDLKSEKIILEILEPSLQQYELALLSEETIDDNSRFNRDYFWCIDPLDGTLAFTESRPGFSISIALVSKDGEPLIGVVYDPSTHTLFSSTKGAGVFKNGAAFALTKSNQENSHKLNSHKLNSHKLTIFTEPSLIEHPSFTSIRSALSQTDISLSWNEIELKQGGGAVINACKVLENHPAVYFKLPKASEGGGSSWDFAATSAIFSELGLVVTDVFGKPLQLNKRGNTFMNHCGVVYASDHYIAEVVQNTLSKSIPGL
jgi:3'-phosphoadenosine 5'-phosphosulfate (PAPS) 3'-phosphatase